MRRLILRVVAGTVLALAAVAPVAFAQDSAASAAQAALAQVAAPVQTAAPALGGPPPGYVAPAEPKPDESNAQRAKSQPGNNAPFWRGVHDSGTQAGTSNLPGVEQGVLIQPFVQYPGARRTNAGEAWRQVRNDWIIPYGGALIVITVLGFALLFFARGPVGGHVPDTGRLIERFTYFERAAHWVNAAAFVVLAISGLVMAFGKFWLLPLVGGTLFGWIGYALKTLHNVAGPLFAVSLLIVFITFVRDNLPGRGDLHWLRTGGGLFGGAEPPSERFNAGEKIVFWGGVFLLGSIVVGSGLVLDKVIPGLAYRRGDMQVAHMIHGIATALMMAMFIGHIYLGTLGIRGAYQGMKTGYVDEGWAREHHAFWAEDIQTGKIPAQRTPVEPGGARPDPDRPAAQY